MPHSLISLECLSVSEQKRREPFHAPVAISQEVNRQIAEIPKSLLSKQPSEKHLAKSCRITFHKLNSIISLKL